jgi:hypothetical protein
VVQARSKTNLAISSSHARAAASGVKRGEGSAVENVGDLAKRGSYLAPMGLFKGQPQRRRFAELSGPRRGNNRKATSTLQGWTSRPPAERTGARIQAPHLASR